MQTTFTCGADVNEHVKTTLYKLLFLDFRNLESRKHCSSTTVARWRHRVVGRCVLFVYFAICSKVGETEHV